MGCDGFCIGSLPGECSTSNTNFVMVAIPPSLLVALPRYYEKRTKFLPMIRLSLKGFVVLRVPGYVLISSDALLSTSSRMRLKGFLEFRGSVKPV
jgi:hypothetical protein